MCEIQLTAPPPLLSPPPIPCPCFPRKQERLQVCEIHRQCFNELSLDDNVALTVRLKLLDSGSDSSDGSSTRYVRVVCGRTGVRTGCGE